MANICCDDVIFYTEGNPEGLYDLWEDLETYIILNQNPDLCWIGNLFSHKKIDSTGISLRGNVSYMEWNDTYILLSLETAWAPLYEAYQAIAAAGFLLSHTDNRQHKSHQSTNDIRSSNCSLCSAD